MPKKVDDELKARAVRLVNDHQGEYSSLTAAAVVDNFEWSEGYSQRFGVVVHVDFATLARTPKDSFAWYRDVIAVNLRRARPRRTVVRAIVRLNHLTRASLLLSAGLARLVCRCSARPTKGLR